MLYRYSLWRIADYWSTFMPKETEPRRKLPVALCLVLDPDRRHYLWKIRSYFHHDNPFFFIHGLQPVSVLGRTCIRWLESSNSSGKTK